ncbi:mCG1032911, partial [Mus musculus]
VLLPKKSCQHVNLETELFSNSVSKQTLKRKKNKTITTTPSLTQKLITVHFLLTVVSLSPGKHIKGFICLLPYVEFQDWGIKRMRK